MSSHNAAFAQRRRSTRVDQALPLLVQGVGAMREPYQEQVSTLSISCHGCTYQSKHEVIQGETVYLDVKAPSASSAGCSSRARVKWVQKTGAKERIFQIAVELEIAGNIWGLATPPEDWFLPRITEAIETSAVGRELKVVARKDQAVVAPDRSADQAPAIERKSATAAPGQPLAQLMAGFGEQIQFMASEAANAALVQEKSRLLEEIRVQLRDDAARAIQAAVSASREVIVRQALKAMSEAHESVARNNYAIWTKKIEQDMESVRQHFLAREAEASRRLDVLAATAIERVQRSMESTRGEVVERFVSRLRDQVGPLLAEAKDSLQKLEASGTAFKRESMAIHAALENQLVFSANASLAKTQEVLEKGAADIAAQTGETLQKLYQSFEKAAQINVESLLASGGNKMAGMFQEKAAEISREFSGGLENYTRSYLETIGKSIAEIPRKIPSIFEK